MHERVRLISRGGEEPGLDQPAVADPLDPAGALREPHIPQATSEQAALACPGRLDPERAKPTVDHVCIDADAIVGAAQFMLPRQQRR